MRNTNKISNNMTKLYIRAAAVALLSVFAGTLSAQTQRGKVTISGYVTDKASGETLIGAGVVCGEAGSATNNYGFYTLTIPQCSQATLKYSYIGYDDMSVAVNLLRDTVINVALTANTSIKASVVSAQKESGIAATTMGAIEIQITEGQYHYLKALSIYDYMDGDMSLSEPVLFPDNVSGGIGLASISVPAVATVKFYRNHILQNRVWY